MKIKILADSSCDIRQDMAERNQIEILPLSVAIGGNSKLDGVELTPDEIYAHVAQGGDLPATAAINPAQYIEFFGKYAAEYDALIHINIGSGFSSCMSRCSRIRQCLYSRFQKSLHWSGHGRYGSCQTGRKWTCSS